MSGPKYSIGIDLGTTNCALAYEPAGGGGSRVFAISQWDSQSRVSASSTLPSFLYRPGPQEASFGPESVWVPGHFARKKAADTPGRVVHSAKSWLAHHAVDRSEPFLPWGSNEIPPGEKLSPLGASAVLLSHLRAAWDAEFAASDPDARFELQDITVTVPASFDAVAQRLTLDAAKAAGFPRTTRLLEEPQAAFYYWLENQPAAANLETLFGADGDEPRHVLVIDIGGGTTDFSLFSIARNTGSDMPRITRVAVSDHILLGGDNIDLAIAHHAETQFAGAGNRLSGGQWNFLVAQCRDLKERCLSEQPEPIEAFPVSIPARGSSLFEDTLTARIERSVIETIALEGFYPHCEAADQPAIAGEGLKEWGLPYASESAITRHLAAFLRGRPRVDAILFNGGSLRPALLRERLCHQVAHWQAGQIPIVLENAEPDLAVARGAARFGGILLRGSTRIEAGAARAIYLEVRPADPNGPAKPSLVCLLPHGAKPGETFRVSGLDLALRINTPVRFQAYSSARDHGDQPGALVGLSRDFHDLPALETTITVPAAKQDTLPVTLSAETNETGLLQVACESADRRVPGSWPLEFNLRATAGPGSAEPAAPADLGVTPEALAAAQERLGSQFQRPLNPRDKISATNLLRDLEKILGLKKSDWNGALIRTLWTTLEEAADSQRHSVEHEEAWLILAGFFLRPGFGAPRDAVRIDKLWDLLSTGPAWPGKRIPLQRLILWRRVAAGLSRERQEALLTPELPKLLGTKPPSAELIRLAGALERVSVSTKTSLAEHFITITGDLAESGQHAAPYLNAIGLLLNRAPLRAGPETVLSADLVETAFQTFGHLDWSEPSLTEMGPLFLRAARRVNDRNLDVPKSLAERIASKLEKSGVSPARVASVRTYRPIEAADQSSLFGESLPAGLVLAGDSESR